MDIIFVNNNTVLGILCFTLFTLFGTCFSRAFTANFVFGDSLVEVGNNNYIPSLSRANYVPNGIDFGWPTGRFTNGRTIVDIIGKFVIYIALLRSTKDSKQEFNVYYVYVPILPGQELGFETFTPPYLAPSSTGPVILHGVNYASGSAGIFNNTGKIFRLYNLGARNIVVVNVGPIGCIPYQRDSNPSLGSNCANSPNLMAQLLNNQLRGLITELGAQFQNSNFLYANAYHIVQDIVQNHASYGFENADSACCHIAGRYGGLFPCGPPSRVCVDRSKYVFWDSFHPSEATNSIIARRLMDGDANDIWPINIRELERFN